MTPQFRVGVESEEAPDPILPRNCTPTKINASVYVYSWSVDCPLLDLPACVVAIVVSIAMLHHKANYGTCPVGHYQCTITYPIVYSDFAAERPLVPPVSHDNDLPLYDQMNSQKSGLAATVFKAAVVLRFFCLEKESRDLTRFDQVSTLP